MSKDKIYEIFIYDSGAIKYEGTFYESPILLSAAQSLMPIINDDQKETQMGAIDVMLNSYIATIVSDIDKSNSQEIFLSELWGNAVRLRTSAYFIKENMIQVEGIDKNIEGMRVMKSSGYSGGKQVDMYIYTNENEISYVKLVYNNLEEIYILKPIINEKLKCFPLINIWTAS